MQVSVATVIQVMGRARSKGVRLWSEGGRLHYRAPPNSVTRSELDELKALKDDIVSFLERARPGRQVEVERVPRQWPNRAPLSFSQRAHWQLYGLAEQRSYCQAVSAWHLCGPLDREALQASLDALVWRHDALRTRVTAVADGIEQCISENGRCNLTVQPLTLEPGASLEQAVSAVLERRLKEGIDVSSEPLFWAHLLQVAVDEHVLLLSLEHLISDAASMAIIVRELFALYLERVGGVRETLPPIALQFADYAQWQSQCFVPWFETHAAQWSERLTSYPRMRLPSSRNTGAAGGSGWAKAALKLNPELKRALELWCKAHGTTLPMTVFSAFAITMLRRCKRVESVFRFQGDGRTSRLIEHTVGYFSCPLYIVVSVDDGDRFSDVLGRTTRAYCEAYENLDSGYFEARLPRPEFTRNAGFNWIPQAAPIDLSQSRGLARELTCTQLRVAYEGPLLETMVRDTEPFLEFQDAGESALGAVYYPRANFDHAAMLDLGRDLVTLLERLVADPEGRLICALSS